MPNQLSTEEFSRALPKKLRKKLNPAIVTSINGMLADPVLMQNYKENLLSYTSVMNNGLWTVQQYVDAVRYVSHKLLGATNIDAFTRTFPQRYKNFLANNTTARDIASYVSSYNKNKLVNLIFEQTLVPSHVLNADMYQNALNVQAALMINPDISPKVRSDAANSLLTHLKMPETQKIELDIGVKENQSIKDLRDSTMALVAAQRKALETGTSTAQEVAHSKLIIEGESEVVSNE